MASCVRYIRTKIYQNLLICFLVTVKNIGDAFLGQSVITAILWLDLLFTACSQSVR